MEHWNAARTEHVQIFFSCNMSTAQASDSDSDFDFINVDFDFQAPVETDYLALKRLFQQLLYTHAPNLDLGVLADWVITLGAQQGVGTVIKVDDAEEVRDPYAVMSAVDLYPENDAPAAKLVQDYFKAQLSRSPAGRPLLQLLEHASAESPVLYALHERMVNMPVPIIPPLLRFIVEETQEARSSGSPSHILFFSRAFSADALEEDDDDQPTGFAGARKRKAAGAHAHPDDAAAAALGRPVARKLQRGLGAPVGDNYGSFRPEDEFIMEVRLCWLISSLLMALRSDSRRRATLQRGMRRHYSDACLQCLLNACHN